LVSFEIALNIKDLHILEGLKSYFGVGRIYKHSENMMRYKVSSIKELSLIIQHFEKYPLMTRSFGLPSAAAGGDRGQKRADFELFKKAVAIISKGTGLLSQEELREIVNLKASLNKGLSPTLKELFPHTIPAERIQVKDELQRNNPEHAEWLAGFVEAEGNFHLGITKNSGLRLGEAVRLIFTLTQHYRDEILLRSFDKFFDGSGNFSMRKGGLPCDYKISEFKDLCNIIIPFFNKYPLYGTKLTNFNEFVKAAEIIKHREHLTPEGLKKLHEIKSRMNILDKT
jgi:hypothetical protein